MEQMNAFMQIVVERGIIYTVGVIVIWRSVKQLLGKKNGKTQGGPDYNAVSDRLYDVVAADKMKGYAKSAVTGQAQVCKQAFDDITRRLTNGDSTMRDMGKQQSEGHSEVMRAIGRLEGAVKANGNGGG